MRFFDFRNLGPPPKKKTAFYFSFVSFLASMIFQNENDFFFNYFFQLPPLCAHKPKPHHVVVVKSSDVEETLHLL